MSDWPGERWQASFRVVTPLFMGGADNQQRVLLSPGGVKGVLRWWWRAVTWPKRHAAADGDEKQALHALHEQEARIFGIAARLAEGDVGKTVHGMGQGALRLRVRWEEGKAPKESKAKTVLQSVASPAMAGVRYLGYGLMEAFASNKKNTKAGELQRPCFDAGGTFSLQLCALPGRLQDDDRASITLALRAMGLLGGLGSRSRRGWGSLSLEALTTPDGPDFAAPTTEDAYRTALSGLLQEARAGDVETEPPFSALCAQSCVSIQVPQGGWAQALRIMGDELVLYRSHGNNGSVLDNKKAEKNFVPDHDWYRGLSNNEVGSDFHPRRAVFGLPQNYDPKTSVSVDKANAGDGVGDRRASPLLLHVHRLSDNAYLPVATLMRSQFLPAGVNISANKKAVRAKPDWSVIETYLDRLGGTRISPEDAA